MPNENTPLYGPGYTVSKDRYGNLADISASLTERWCSLGLSWSMTTGYQSLANAADYAYITFKTPATGSAQGASIPGGSSQLQGVVLLKKNTVYALKLTAKGAATFSASVGFGYIATA